MSNNNILYITSLFDSNQEWKSWHKKKGTLWYTMVHTDELKSIVLRLVERFVDDDGVDVALLVLLWMGLYDKAFEE